MKLSVVIGLCAVLLAACGGSGVSLTGASTNQSTNQSTGSQAPAPFKISPATASAHFVQGYPTAINLTATQTTSYSGNLYIFASTGTAMFSQPSVVQSATPGTLDVTFVPLSTLVAGTYTGIIIVNICTDSSCADPLPGSPFTIPYSLDVILPAGGLSTFNVATLTPLSGANDWETFQGNASHTGYVPVTLNSADFSERFLWDLPSTQGVQPQLTGMTNSGGMIFVSATQGPFTSINQTAAYSESDLSLVWLHSYDNLASPNANPPAVSNGIVYAAAGSQTSTFMFGFDATTGAVLFQTPMSSQWENYLAPTIYGGVVYTDGGAYGGLYAFNDTTGSTNFYQSLPQYSGWTPAVDSQNTYSYVGGSLYINNAASGAPVASIVDPTFQFGSYVNTVAPVLGAPGSVFAGNFANGAANAVLNFNTTSDTVNWTVAGQYAGNPAYNAGTLYAVNDSPFRLEALSESNGTLAWSWTPPSGDSKFLSDVLLTNNLIFVSTDTNTYAIDTTSHASVWQFAATGKLSLSANGILYIVGPYSMVAINLH